MSMISKNEQEAVTKMFAPTDQRWWHNSLNCEAVRVLSLLTTTIDSLGKIADAGCRVGENEVFYRRPNNGGSVLESVALYFGVLCQTYRDNQMKDELIDALHEAEESLHELAMVAYGTWSRWRGLNKQLDRDICRVFGDYYRYVVVNCDLAACVRDSLTEFRAREFSQYLDWKMICAYLNGMTE